MLCIHSARLGSQIQMQAGQEDNLKEGRVRGGEREEEEYVYNM